MNKRILGIAALVAASMGIGSAEPYRAQLPELRDAPPTPPRAKREPAQPARPRRATSESRRERKAREKAERLRRHGGISGAGLWRKCRAGGRVRGY